MPYTSANWRGKAAAGVILGFAIALLASGLFAWFGPGGLMAGTGKTQFNMWLISPVWAFILSFVFLFPTSRAAWGYLGATSVVLAVLLFGGRWLLSGAAA